MFKKFAIFLTPFVLAPLGSFFTPSEAHAQTSYKYSNWNNCYFSLQNYSSIQVGIEQRNSDSAARSRYVQVSYGGITNERIQLVEVWETQSISGQPTKYFPTLAIFTNYQPTYLSPTFNPPREFISNLGVRYIHVRLSHADGRRCTTQFPL
jgi:hypothetical protein